ncbi:Xaa-Pro aminopeptidase, partial [Pseudomonas syringae pv. tagetis]
LGFDFGVLVLFCGVGIWVGVVWVGVRAGQVGGLRVFGADDAFRMHEMAAYLPVMYVGRDRGYSAIGCNPVFDRHLRDWNNVI